MNINDKGQKFSNKRRGYMTVEKAGFPESHERRIQESQYIRDRDTRRQNTKELGIHAVGLFATLVIVNALMEAAGGYDIFDMQGIILFWMGMMIAKTVVYLLDNHEKTGHAFCARDWKSEKRLLKESAGKKAFVDKMQRKW